MWHLPPDSSVAPFLGKKKQPRVRDDELHGDLKRWNPMSHHPTVTKQRGGDLFKSWERLLNIFLSGEKLMNRLNDSSFQQYKSVTKCVTLRHRYLGFFPGSNKVQKVPKESYSLQTLNVGILPVNMQSWALFSTSSNLVQTCGFNHPFPPNPKGKQKQYKSISHGFWKSLTDNPK